MEGENIHQILQTFNEILFESEQQSVAEDEALFREIFGRTQPKPPRIEVNFENFVREFCNGKITLLERAKFHQVKRPIVIFFNHFRRKCAYHSKWLHIMCQLASKYGQRIEFIAGDMLDIDVMHRQWQALDYFPELISPERDVPKIFAIDERKRTYQYTNSNKSLEKLMVLCENLVNGKLYASEPEPDNDETNLVKTCVHQNYEDLVLKSNKHILLVVGGRRNNPYDTNYEKVAHIFKDNNLEVCYLRADRNYVPFELNITRYPSLLYFPAHNKNIAPVNFGYSCRKDEYVVAWLKQQLDDSAIRSKEELKLPTEQEVKVLTDLQNYLAENFNDCIKLFNREHFYDNQLGHQNIVLIFVNLQLNNTNSQLAKYLQKMYELKENFQFEVEFLVAEFKDFDVISHNCECENYSQAVRSSENKIYAFDCQQHVYEYVSPSPSPSLDDFYYFLSDLTKGQLYYSQLAVAQKSQDQPSLVATCVADNLSFYIQHSRRHIGLLLYWPNYKNSGKTLAALESIARKVKKLGVKIIKINAQVNYIPLEYTSDHYPVFYFIHSSNKYKIQRCLSKCPLELVDFIATNVAKV